MSCVLRDIVDLAACRDVVSLQAAVWGRDAELVPASVLFVSAKRGGILIGAYDDIGLAGFVWSMPGWKDGRPSHWSHMLAVLPRARGRRLGERLKHAQRGRAAAQGAMVIEWTFDPLQAANAHLNLTKLGAVSSTYLVNVYGDMPGPLHRGTETDRLIAEWWIDDSRPLVTAGPENASAIATRASGPWIASGRVREGLDAETVVIPVPPNFTGMQREARDIALAWRTATRRAFQHYFARGYSAVGFTSGGYLLRRKANGTEQRTG